MTTAPHNLEAEQQILGSILVDNEVFHRVAPLVAAADFYHEQHAEIFGAVGRLIAAGRYATPTTLQHEFDPEFLRRLAVMAVLPAAAPDFAKLVHDLAMRRALVKAGEELAAKASTAPIEASAEEMLEAAETALAALSTSSGPTVRQCSLTQSLTDVVDVIAAAYERERKLVGLTTGLTDLDNKLGGLVPSELVILAGRPSMGKSALAANIAETNARAGTPVGFFTVEMSAQQISMRMLADASHVSAYRMRRGDFSPEEFERILEAAGELQRAPIRFDETAGITIEQLRARARRWKRQHNIGLLVVDYLQLMAGSGKRRDGRVQEVAEITTGLKALAKELAIPVLALSQLSRGVESREDKRPQLSDLRESGSIEQDADVVLFIYREDYYLERLAPKADTDAHGKWQARMDRASGRAEIIISKQRHGPTGMVEVAFEPRFTKFRNLVQPSLLAAE